MVDIWNDPGPDGGWSWVIAVSCFLVNLCANGLLRSQGVLYSATITHFGISREEASWPYSLSIATACFSGVLVGILTHLVSVRQILFITGLLVTLGHVLCYLTFFSIHWVTFSYGVIAGFGTGFVTPCLAIMTNSYFSKARVTANGISLSGTTCGAFVFPVLTNYLLAYYGLPGTFLVLGGIGLNVLVGASMLRPRSSHFFQCLEFNKNDSTEPCLLAQQEPLEESPLESRLAKEYYEKVETPVGLTLPERRSVGGKIVRVFWSTVTEPMFTVVALSALSSILVLLLFVMVIVDHAIDVGLSKDNAILLLPIFSLPDLIGRLCTGWISDKGYVRRKHIYMITKSLSGILMIFLPMVRLEMGIYALCSILGFLEGSATILTSVLFMDYLGLERLPAALSIWSFSIGVVFLGCPPLIGLFRDFYGKYDRLFFLMGGVSISTSATWLLEPSIVKWRESKLNKRSVSAVNQLET